MIAVFSRKMFNIPGLDVFLGKKTVFYPRSKKHITAVAGWGYKEPSKKARLMARKWDLPYLAVEDGFLRSYGLGVTDDDPLSLVVDDQGIYYDASKPSSIETILENHEFSPDFLQTGGIVLNTLRKNRLSKYNHAPDMPDRFFKDSDKYRVLVVDQTYGDASIELGMAGQKSFQDMLQAAFDEHPEADIYIKTHPDVLAGKKKGCLDPHEIVQDVQWIGQNFCPHSLIEKFDHVYVVTSQMGLDALIQGKKVTCFGLPFYAGWGLTTDKIKSFRRTRKRSLKELITAAYLWYAKYLDPLTGKKGNFFDVARFIASQKKAANQLRGRVFCFGFQCWKPPLMRPFFGPGAEPIFLRNTFKARKMGISSNDHIAVWGRREGKDVRDLARELGVPVIRVEDGFVRSVGLGADFIPPMSLVFDKTGIYYDPSERSDLEHILQHTDFPHNLLEEARCIIDLIVKNRITKYNTEPLEDLDIVPGGRKVILVPGQVEGDASILKGAGAIKTNLELLKAARNSDPEAFVIYKPHPDVMSGNRRGRAYGKSWLNLCDHVETRKSVISCIEACDEVHTMTSLSGFDALLRNKKVYCYGAPFYSGWGLTVDAGIVSKRTRTLSLDELVAGTLILYPRYYDWEAQGFVDCAQVIKRIIEKRAENPSNRSYTQCRIHKWMRYLKLLMGRGRKF